jgi:hypothetical protein
MSWVVNELSSGLLTCSGCSLLGDMDLSSADQSLTRLCTCADRCCKQHIDHEVITRVGKRVSW